MIRLMGLIDLDNNVSSLKEEEKWIQKAIEKPGALKKQLGVPEDETIPAEKLKAAAKKGGKLGKRARLAMTLRKLHEEGHIDEEQYNYLREKLDPVGKEDDDVDNDGDVDSSDKYLKHRRDVISKNINEDQVDFEEQDNGDDSVVTSDGEDDHEGSMAKAQLMALHKETAAIYNMLGDNEDLEGWVQSKITKAADYISAVYRNLEHEKKNPASLGNGEGTPAEPGMGIAR